MEQKHAHPHPAGQPSVLVSSGAFSPDAFAVVMEDIALESAPEPVQRGSTVIFEPHDSPRDGDAVLVHEPGRAAIIRQMVIDGDEHYIISPASTLPARGIAPGHIVAVAVAVAVYTMRKRK